MSKTNMLDVEVRLINDHDGSYRAQLIEVLEKYRNEFASVRQGLLPPDESELAESMEKALDAALSIIKGYEAPDTAVENEASTFLP